MAVVPALATAVVVANGLSRRGTAAERLLAAVALPTVGAIVVSVAFVSASLDVDGTENLNERYIFYVVPILFVGLALWIESGLPRPRWTVAVAAGALILVVVLPIERLDYNAGFQSLALLPWLGLLRSSFAPSELVLASLVGMFGLLCVALWFSSRRAVAGRLWLLTAIVLVVVGFAAFRSNATTSSRAAGAFAGQSATWVDDAVPDGSEVVVLWDQGRGRPTAPGVDGLRLMVTEFFNRSVKDVYRFGGPTYYENVLPTVPVSRSARAIVDGRGARVSARYVLETCGASAVGTVLARAPQGFLRLVAVDPPLRLAERSRCPRQGARDGAAIADPG